MDMAHIQHAIQELPKDEQWALAAWLSDRKQADWDTEIERDFSPGGDGMVLLDEMKADMAAGHFRRFQDLKQR